MKSMHYGINKAKNAFYDVMPKEDETKKLVTSILKRIRKLDEDLPNTIFTCQSIDIGKKDNKVNANIVINCIKQHKYFTIIIEYYIKGNILFFRIEGNVQSDVIISTTLLPFAEFEIKARYQIARMMEQINLLSNVKHEKLY